MDTTIRKSYEVPKSERIAEALLGRYAREILELMQKPKLTPEELRRLPELREFARLHKMFMSKHV
jgi:hypothetical protein